MKNASGGKQKLQGTPRKQPRTDLTTSMKIPSLQNFAMKEVMNQLKRSKTIGSSLQIGSKALLLKITPAELTEHEKIELVPA
ncbi:hypothetical protein STEG23_009718 [Scotinomys teguina]